MVSGKQALPGADSEREHPIASAVLGLVADVGGHSHPLELLSAAMPRTESTSIAYGATPSAPTNP